MTTQARVHARAPVRAVLRGCRDIVASARPLLASGRKSFYETAEGRETQFGPQGPVPVPERDGVVSVAALKARGGVAKKNAGASLVDMGDGSTPLSQAALQNNLEDLLGCRVHVVSTSGLRYAREHVRDQIEGEAVPL